MNQNVSRFSSKWTMWHGDHQGQRVARNRMDLIFFIITATYYLVTNTWVCSQKTQSQMQWLGLLWVLSLPASVSKSTQRWVEKLTNISFIQSANISRNIQIDVDSQWDYKSRMFLSWGIHLAKTGKSKMRLICEMLYWNTKEKVFSPSKKLSHENKAKILIKICEPERVWMQHRRLCYEVNNQQKPVKMCKTGILECIGNGNMFRGYSWKYICVSMNSKKSIAAVTGPTQI